MKKHLIFTVLCLMITLVSASLVSAGYNFGPNNIFHMEASAGINWLRGEWVEGTMSNGHPDARNYFKRIYARSGDGGTYSDWAPKDQTSITHRDYGAFGNDYAVVKGEWATQL